MLKSGLRTLAAMVFLGMAACSHLETPPPVVAIAPQTPRLILISIDGFRADYLKEGITPNLQAWPIAAPVRRCGHPSQA